MITLRELVVALVMFGGMSLGLLLAYSIDLHRDWVRYVIAFAIGAGFACLMLFMGRDTMLYERSSTVLEVYFVVFLVVNAVLSILTMTDERSTR